VDTDLSVMEVVCFPDDHSARIEFQKTPFHLFEVVDLQTYVV
jgi:hypothetical protein